MKHELIIKIYGTNKSVTFDLFILDSFKKKNPNQVKHLKVDANKKRIINTLLEGILFPEKTCNRIPIIVEPTKADNPVIIKYNA